MIDKNKSAFAVLFVDDEEKARKMFVRLVSSHFTVFTASDVKEAMEVLEKEADHIGVLITDQRMPGQLGVDLLRYVRKEYPRIMRLLTTAYSDLSDAIDAVNTGEIFRYINKPWNVDELLIDLHLAMDFFTLQQDRLQLIQEKLSVSHHQTTINTLKNMITLASSQTQYQQPLRAVESLLQQLADPLDALENSPLMMNEGYWTKEIQQTERMIEATRTLSEYLLEDSAVSDTALALEADIKQPHFDQTKLSHLVNACIQAFKSDDTEIDTSNSNEAIQINLKTNTPNTWLAEQFINPADAETNQTISKLLGAFIMVYHIGGNIKLGFDNSKLNTVQVNLPQSSANEELKDIEGSVWMEDLFVLYS